MGGLGRPHANAMPWSMAWSSFGQANGARPAQEMRTDLYQRRCAVTQGRSLPALEAAHIRPYAEGGQNEASNGLLFRRDLHSLFYAGYGTVTPELRFEVSRRVREEFDNGKHYCALHGRQIATPGDARQRPDRAALAWRNENAYRG